MNEQPAALCDAAAAPTPGSGARRDAPGVALVCLAGMAATVVFVSWPEIDLGAARLFVDESHRFFLARHPMPRLFNTLIDVLAVVLIVSSLGGLAYTGLGRRTLAGHGPRAYAFIFASVAIGPGLIANALFKNQWGRARPRQIIEFGGTADFTPALAFADQCTRNCSFVAGDASLAFATLAVALLAPAATRARWIALAILFGAFIGFIRIIQGAHFLSDVVFAAIFVSLAVVLLKGMILEGRWGGAAVERMLARAVRRVSETIPHLAAPAARREFWLRILPGLRDLGVVSSGPHASNGKDARD
jgi:lipid A 4'-phosphatase